MNSDYLKTSFSLAVMTLLAFNIYLGQARADIAPGEDPIFLQQRVNFNMLPINSPPKSTTSTNTQEIPSWLDAKLARYQAKAYSADTTGLITEKDVTTTVSNDGIRKTCTQDIASNIGASSSGSTRYGPKSDPQVVVLRGDLVNICK